MFPYTHMPLRKALSISSNHIKSDSSAGWLWPHWLLVGLCQLWSRTGHWSANIYHWHCRNKLTALLGVGWEYIAQICFSRENASSKYRNSDQSLSNAFWSSLLSFIDNLLLFPHRLLEDSAVFDHAAYKGRKLCQGDVDFRGRTSAKL